MEQEKLKMCNFQHYITDALYCLIEALTLSNIEIDSLVNQSIKKLYLATCEGNFSIPVESVPNIDVRIKNGYVDLTECRRDTRSKHNTKTCRVKMVWLTEKGKEIGNKQTPDGYFEVQKKWILS